MAGPLLRISEAVFGEMAGLQPCLRLSPSSKLTGGWQNHSLATVALLDVSESSSHLEAKGAQLLSL